MLRNPLVEWVITLLNQAGHYRTRATQPDTHLGWLTAADHDEGEGEGAEEGEGEGEGDEEGGGDQEEDEGEHDDDPVKPWADSRG